MEHFNLTISHLIWIRKQKYAKTFLESIHCKLIAIHCLFSGINTFVLMKNDCVRLTLSFFFSHKLYMESCCWVEVPGESVNRSKLYFTDLREQNNQPVQLHENAQKI